MALKCTTYTQPSKQISYFMFRRVEGRGVSVEVYERELGWKKL